MKGKKERKKETLCTYKLKVQIYQTSIGKVWIETLINIKNKKEEKMFSVMTVFGGPANNTFFLFFCRLSTVASYSFSRMAVAGLSNRTFVPCSKESSHHVMLCRIIIYYIIYFFIALIADPFALVNNLLSSDWQTHSHKPHLHFHNILHLHIFTITRNHQVGVRWRSVRCWCVRTSRSCACASK